MHTLFSPPLSRRQVLLAGMGATAWLSACTATPQVHTTIATARAPSGRNFAALHAVPGSLDKHERQRWLDRLTWGQNDADQEELARLGIATWLTLQLNASPGALSSAAQAQIDAMRITREPFATMAIVLQEQRKATKDLPDADARRDAMRAYQQQMNALAREARQRFVLRALYSPHQLLEHMTWFWMNHFSVSTRKADVRALVADYEEHAIRPHALGRFRDLLWASLTHPAMLRYLDNAQNAAGHLNENYARELMELHTMGVGSGYTQGDVQEMARVLTGCSLDLRPLNAPPPRMRPELRSDYRRESLFEFNPARHDYGPKTLLGQPLYRRGLDEVHEAVTRITRTPATAHFIARKLAVFFVADDPPAALVQRVQQRFLQTDGDIAEVLATLFAAPEYAASLGKVFRDPVHYVLAAVRLAWGERVIANPDAAVGWIARMGEPFYGHETPDGYPLTESNWSSSGQMSTRFEIAHTLASQGNVLFRTAPGAPLPPPREPPLAESAAVQAWLPHLSDTTRAALQQARNPAEWNTYLLSSPEMMRR